MKNPTDAPGRPGALHSDVGPFAILPEWLLDTDVSDRAVRLYGLLGRYTDKMGAAFPARRTLASRLRCSVDTVDRTVKELVDVGALEVQARFAPAGDRTSNWYRLAQVRPGGRSDAAPPAAAVRPMNETQGERDEEHSPHSPPGTDLAVRSVALGKVDRQVVKPEHEHLARLVLSEWNRQTSQALGSKDWLAKIVMRIREHPDLGIEEHAHVIQASLAAPWWTGPPTPSVVYGNGAQFERSVVTAQKGPGPPPRRYGVGMTSAEILKATQEPG